MKNISNNNNSNKGKRKEQFEDVYEYQGLIERGSEGIVYSVLHKQSKQVFSCKKIEIPKSGTTLLRVTQEIQILNTMKHRNITSLRQLFLEERNSIHHVYIIYDLAPSNLLQMIKANRITTTFQMKYIISQMAHALHYLHRNNIIHRDIKPSNVLVYDKFLIKLCDFGSSKFVQQEEGYPSIQSVCTRIYLPPECFSEGHEETTAIDIWQLGCVYLQMILKSPPFKGSSYSSIKKSIMTTFIEDFKFQNEGNHKKDISKGEMCKKEINKQFDKVMRKEDNDVIKGHSLPQYFSGLHIEKESQELIYLMLQLHPKKRITAYDIVNHKSLSAFKHDMKCMKENDDVHLQRRLMTGREDYQTLIELIEKEIIVLTYFPDIC